MVRWKEREDSYLVLIGVEGLVFHATRRYLLRLCCRANVLEPFAALKDDMNDRLQINGIGCLVWKSSEIKASSIDMWAVK